jgi:hypothetical protein
MKSVKKYQAGGKVVVKDRKDKEGIAAERAKGNTVYIPKPKPKAKALMQTGGATKVELGRTNPKKSIAQTRNEKAVAQGYASLADKKQKKQGARGNKAQNAMAWTGVASGILGAAEGVRRLLKKEKKGGTIKKRTTTLMQKGGATNVGKSTTTKKGSMATMSKTPSKPEAAYGMAVKPGMMKKGGTMKRKK